MAVPSFDRYTRCVSISFSMPVCTDVLEQLIDNCILKKLIAFASFC
jgi:hypothetical protein